MIGFASGKGDGNVGVGATDNGVITGWVVAILDKVDEGFADNDDHLTLFHFFECERLR